MADNGIGFPVDLDFRHTASLGMQLLLVLTEQLQGSIELERGAGTRFILRFPGQRE
jgi:two-component sensor histidine kinase